MKSQFCFPFRISVMLKGLKHSDMQSCLFYSYFLQLKVYLNVNVANAHNTLQNSVQSGLTIGLLVPFMCPKPQTSLY